MNECGCSAAGQRARNNTKLSKLIAAGASELVDVQEEAKLLACGSFRVKSTNFLQISSSIISDFDKIFTECALMY